MTCCEGGLGAEALKQAGHDLSHIYQIRPYLEAAGDGARDPV